MRFPEFTGEWEKHKVSDLLDTYSTNSLSWEQLNYKDEGLYNLHYGLVHVGLPTMIDMSKDNIPTIKADSVPKNYELCQEGDVAFADASEDTNEVAKVVEFFSLADKRVICGLHTIHGRDNKDKTVVGFKGYAFSSPAFHNQIRRIAQGTKIYSISSKNFTECTIGIPSKEEQKKIATLFRLLDERISTQIRVIEKLESLMGGLFHTLTSSGNPNIKIQDCLYCSSSTLQESDVKEQGRYPVYGANGVIGFRDEYTEMDNAILVIKDGASVGNIRYTSGRYSFIGTLNCLKSKSDFSLRYLYYSLKSFNFKTYITGMAIPHIYFKDYGKAMIYCPSLPEQRRIAEILTAIDEKIQNENAILESYRTEKQYLLRQMFA